MYIGLIGPGSYIVHIRVRVYPSQQFAAKLG